MSPPEEPPVPNFEVLTDAKVSDRSLSPFMVSTTRGFLPRMDPVVELPPEFAPLEAILQTMPIKKTNGTPGLLAAGKLGEAVEGLEDLSAAVEKYREDLPVMTALYRDYCFLASAYLLEPCHLRFMKGEDYGLARDVLPRQISLPIKRCADISGFMPWMEYAGSYALYNYRLADPTRGMTYDNLRLIRAFEHGLDPTSSEAGFVLVHIEMVKHSPALVSATLAALLAADAAHPDRPRFNAALSAMNTALSAINAAMDKMWTKSLPRQYTSFRTFIFGITSQSMFPRGVVYSGVNNDEPLSFRGESGANDSMIPLMDSFLQLPLPSTPLTEILLDFRKYRPGNHRAFLAHVRDASLAHSVKSFALGLSDVPSASSSPSSEAEDPSLLRDSRSLWLSLLDQVRAFRYRHWSFAREYILKQTAHPTATGGSPIVTWLPNQLTAVLDEMQRVYAAASVRSFESGAGTGKAEKAPLGEDIADMMDKVDRQSETLRKEVERFCKERGLTSA